MRIGELSALTGVSRRSLRYYEQHGLLESRRSENGWREYDQDAVVRVRNIRELLGSGLSVADLQRVAPCLDQDLDPEQCYRVLEIYNHRLAELDRKISVLAGHRDRLEKRISGVG
ncbi:MerR family transcriptional regulator [Nocardiopsis gilva YIM 90087]|uniref:MerR family transcriptional regulator n=1 Tax=Nocardiopsis gilva YIM 90087 TaxID=1235441 RepID=A0A223SCZ0_9ACTN|nr:MerR family transcriptional regulator [Nocardiopsis gilva]ASU85955.1 MerR family transcriptional regulator [Nocardiopsis gilva YIM 90087]